MPFSNKTRARARKFRAIATAQVRYYPAKNICPPAIQVKFGVGARDHHTCHIVRFKITNLDARVEQASFSLFSLISAFLSEVKSRQAESLSYWRRISGLQNGNVTVTVVSNGTARPF